jgi:hypothetical protein
MFKLPSVTFTDIVALKLCYINLLLIQMCLCSQGTATSSGTDTVPVVSVATFRVTTPFCALFTATDVAGAADSFHVPEISSTFCLMRLRINLKPPQNNIITGDVRTGL